MHGTLNLQAIANDPGVVHQRREFFRAVACDGLGIEAVEGSAEVLAFAQNGDPGKSGLKAVEHELFEERAVVVFRHAPLVVVIREVERVLAYPAAARKSVGKKLLAHPVSVPQPSRDCPRACTAWRFDAALPVAALVTAPGVSRAATSRQLSAQVRNGSGSASDLARSRTGA